jgi:hypothetical protein
MTDKEKELQAEAIDYYRKQIADLEKENAELKTKKIPQLERRIASIRGSHSVDAKKLNARIEQVERLKKENAVLKEKVNILDNCDRLGDVIIEAYKDQLAKAKEYIKLLLMNCVGVYESTGKTIAEIQAEAEQFLREVEK